MTSKAAEILKLGGFSLGAAMMLRVDTFGTNAGMAWKRNCQPPIYAENSMLYPRIPNCAVRIANGGIF